MKTGWKTMMIGGAVLTLVAGQAVAQGWCGGFGRGRGGPGMSFGPQGGGRMGARGLQGQGGPGMGFRAQGGGRMGARGLQGQSGSGAWRPLGPGQPGFAPRLSNRLGLTEKQTREIGAILEKARLEVQAAIGQVLTDEQREQFERLQQWAGPRGRATGNDGPRDRLSRPRQGRAPWTAGPGPQMRPGTRGRGAQPFAGDPSAGRGQRPQNWRDRSGETAKPPAANSNVNAERPRGQGVPPLEQVFEEADANHDGTLTKQEIQAFYETRRRGGRPGRQ